MKYIIKQIIEPDYGCEERPDNYVARDKVILRDDDEQEIIKEIPDAELYEKDINVGDRVYFDRENQIVKEEGKNTTF